MFCPCFFRQIQRKHTRAHAHVKCLFIATWAIFTYPAVGTITDDRDTNSDRCLAPMTFSSEGSLHATPAATRDLGLYGFLRPTVIFKAAT
jgi:hypothetical protein